MCGRTQGEEGWLVGSFLGVEPLVLVPPPLLAAAVGCLLLMGVCCCVCFSLFLVMCLRVFLRLILLLPLLPTCACCPKQTRQLPSVMPTELVHKRAY